MASDASEIRHVGVVGLGLLGADIVALLLSRGLQVKAVDINADARSILGAWKGHEWKFQEESILGKTKENFAIGKLADRVVPATRTSPLPARRRTTVPSVSLPPRYVDHPMPGGGSRTSWCRKMTPCLNRSRRQ